LKRGFERVSSLAALGGGVIGDFTGFLASTYLRGIDFIQIPTTYLAAVDASVGGKVAVNIGSGKNIVGSFYQPRCVIIIPDFLKSLPEREWRVGWAEVIKHSLIGDSQLFHYLFKRRDSIRKNGYELVKKAIIHSIRLKASVVSKDEKESGYREILNFGHTVGHGIESYYNYRKFNHGEAVAVGMVSALLLSKKLVYLSDNSVSRAISLIESAGLPLKTDIPFRDLKKHILFDKKKKDGILRFVLLKKIGSCSYGNEINLNLLRETWQIQRKMISKIGFSG
jgi:3-dehydroquinate synthase